MILLIFLAFITIPIVEIAVFIQVGERIGLWPTIGIVIATAMLGTAMLRQQGISILFRIQETMNANRIPVQELFDGVCLVIAGALLLTPGFVTDSIGLLLFIAPLRRWMAGEIGKRFLAKASVQFSSDYQSGPRDPYAGDPGGPIIDGDFQDITENDEAPEADRKQIDHEDKRGNNRP